MSDSTNIPSFPTISLTHDISRSLHTHILKPTQHPTFPHDNDIQATPPELYADSHANTQTPTQTDKHHPAARIMPFPISPAMMTQWRWWWWRLEVHEPRVCRSRSVNHFPDIRRSTPAHLVSVARRGGKFSWEISALRHHNRRQLVKPIQKEWERRRHGNQYSSHAFAPVPALQRLLVMGCFPHLFPISMIICTSFQRCSACCLHPSSRPGFQRDENSLPPPPLLSRIIVLAQITPDIPPAPTPPYLEGCGKKFYPNYSWDPFRGVVVPGPPETRRNLASLQFGHPLKHTRQRNVKWR